MAPSPNPETKPSTISSISEMVSVPSNLNPATSDSKILKTLLNLENHSDISFFLTEEDDNKDNYLSLIKTLYITAPGKPALQLFLKCFPVHPERQEFVKRTNLFFKEMQVYTQAFIKLQKYAQLIQPELSGRVLLVPKYINGHCIDFDTKHGRTMLPQSLPSLSNIIILEDARNSGYSMLPSGTFLELPHVLLTVRAIARLHAISWAYKNASPEKETKASLVDMFPFLKLSLDPKDIQGWRSLLIQNLEKAILIYDSEFGVGNPYSQGTRRFMDLAMKVHEAFFQGKMKSSQIEKEFRKGPGKLSHVDRDETAEEWKVMIHGDCWRNNLLFKMDENNNAPIDVMLVDFQFTTNACPINDLQNLLYTSIDSKTRKQHLPEILETYHTTFTQLCITMNCPILPGFTLDRLNYRFHRGKFLGFFVANLVLPVIFKVENPLDHFGDGKGGVVNATFGKSCEESGPQERLKRCLIELAEEMYEDGVL